MSKKEERKQKEELTVKTTATIPAEEIVEAKPSTIPEPSAVVPPEPKPEEKPAESLLVGLTKWFETRRLGETATVQELAQLFKVSPEEIEVNITILRASMPKVDDYLIYPR